MAESSDFSESASESASESLRAIKEINTNILKTIDRALHTLNSNNEQVKRLFSRKIPKLKKMNSKVQRFEQHSDPFFTPTIRRAQKIMAAVEELRDFVDTCYAHKTLDLDEYTLENDENYYSTKKRQKTDDETKETTESDVTPRQLQKCRAAVVDMEFILSKLILEVNENNVTNASVVTILTSRVETLKEDMDDHINELSLLLSEDNDEVEDVQEKTGLFYSVVKELDSFQQSCLQVHFEMSFNQNAEVELSKKSLYPKENQGFKGKSNLFAKDIPLSAYVQRK